MSEGSRIIHLRLPDPLEKQAIDCLNRKNRVTRGEPLTMSSWIRQLIQAEIDHMERGKEASKKRRKKAPVVADPQPQPATEPVNTPPA